MNQKKGDQIKINSIMTKTKEIVPVTPITIDIKKITEMKLTFEKKPLTDKIDEEILKGQSNYIVDERIRKVNENMFIEEAYQLFRLEFSNYVNKEENVYYKNRFEKIMNSTVDKSVKVDKIRLIIYKIIDKNLYDKYVSLMNVRDDDDQENKDHQENQDHQTKSQSQSGGESYNYTQLNDNPLFNTQNKDFQIGGKINKMIQKISKIPDTIKYHINNDRKVCEIHENKEQCNNNSHCKWSQDKCYMGLTTDMIVMFVNRISEELAQNDLKAFEIMKVGTYFVSDIVDRNKFTYIPGQKIIRASSSSIRRSLQELLGKDNIPSIGKRKVQKKEINYTDLNLQNPLIDMIDIFIQKIIPNNITLFRAYANGFHWLKNNFHDPDTRNLGYYSVLQSNIANNFKAVVIEWLSNPDKQNKITPGMIEGMGIRIATIDPIKEFIIRLSNDVITTSNGIAEFMVLSKINNEIPIIIRNDTNKIIHIFDSGNHHSNPNQAVISKYDVKKCINLKYEYVGNSSIPDVIEVIYYKNSAK